MEDPFCRAERDRSRRESATDRDQPARPRVTPAKAARGHDPDATHDGEAEKPAGLPPEAGVEQPERPGRPPEEPAARVLRRRRRAAGLSANPPHPVVADDERPDAVVTRPGDP